MNSYDEVKDDKNLMRQVLFVETFFFFYGMGFFPTN